SRKGFLLRRPIRPSARRRSAGQPRSIALARTQTPKSALANLQNLTVGPLAGDIVLARLKRRLAQRDATLIDQPARLRAGDAELLRDQAREMDHAAITIE